MSELDSARLCADICCKRDPPLMSLASMETAILMLAAELTCADTPVLSKIVGWSPQTFKPDIVTIAKAILPFLETVCKRELKQIPHPKKTGINEEVKPDTNGLSGLHLNEIDPFSNEDFNCKICLRELCNKYYKCQGCWLILAKDYNICADCYHDNKYIRDNNSASDTDEHFAREIARSCKCLPSKNKCRECKKCQRHTCMCHNEFLLHYRFYTKQDLHNILENCRKWAG